MTHPYMLRPTYGVDTVGESMPLIFEHHDDAARAREDGDEYDWNIQFEQPDDNYYAAQRDACYREAKQCETASLMATYWSLVDH